MYNINDSKRSSIIVTFTKDNCYRLDGFFCSSHINSVSSDKWTMTSVLQSILFLHQIYRLTQNILQILVGLPDRKRAQITSVGSTKLGPELIIQMVFMCVHLVLIYCYSVKWLNQLIAIIFFLDFRLLQYVATNKMIAFRKEHNGLYYLITISQQPQFFPL